MNPGPEVHTHSGNTAALQGLRRAFHGSLKTEVGATGLAVAPA